MPGTIWIGPTECDEMREHRTKTVESIWIRLKPDLGLHLDLGNAVDFFREAQSCYQNGAFMATALMCRSSTETAVYLALSRKRKGLETAIDLDSIHEKWIGILSQAKQSRLVDD